MTCKGHVSCNMEIMSSERWSWWDVLRRFIANCTTKHWLPACLIGRHCFACCHLSASSAVLLSVTGVGRRPPPCWAHGRSGDRHCTAGQFGRHLVLLWSAFRFFNAAEVTHCTDIRVNSLLLLSVLSTSYWCTVDCAVLIFLAALYRKNRKDKSRKKMSWRSNRKRLCVAHVVYIQ